MALPRFHVDPLVPGRLALAEQEAHHARGARRLSEGEAVGLFDGQGRKADGVLAEITRKTVIVQVASVEKVERRTPMLTLATALPKGPRQDFLIEKCTELGVAELIPLVTERSVATASAHKLSKWHRTAIEAAKQCGQAWMPGFEAPKSLDDVTGRTADVGISVMCQVGAPPIHERLSELAEANHILAIVGPEGGLTETELARLKGAGVRPISLGGNILRIETAAIAMAAFIHALASTESP